MSIKEDINYYTWSTSFDATVVIDGAVFPNHYECSISFLPKSTSVKIQNIHFDKIKYMFKTFENSLIFNIEDEHKDFWYKMVVNKVLLPSQPYDQLLAVCIRNKIISICGEHFDIGEISLDSKLGDNVQYIIDEDSYENKVANEVVWEDNPWWTRDDTATFDQKMGDDIWRGAVSWKDLGYVYEPEGNTKFKPTVIDGGREQ